ncbi:Multiple sugar ABC transporter, ATP-binding protein [Brevinematales bacterium NS]|jgi:multiple sugar transport system ATP-binding protein|nr:sn-glycerol-3-phosphate ABC transporter ATP-binding protein UgpC [Brevinematales bacterium]QJR21822.1 Multiple sugar ABC transporter, ATP-binding protein [Brevinematales bacterium NS]
MAHVVLRNVSKVYEGNVVAVQDVNLEINDKEFVVLVGPSGCGKSTTLRMIAGLEEITKGEILIDGVVVNNKPPKDRDIAMVFQNYALYPHMTVAENMAFGLKLRHFPPEEIKKRVNEAAQILGLTEYLNRKPKALSGGQRQRVAIGRAIVRKPKVYLFDEPLSNLDAKLRVQMRAELIKIHARMKTTSIYVTHDQIEAMTMGDKIVVMNNKLVQQIGTPLEVYNNPVNKFVAGFIGSPPMNFLDCTVKDSNGALWLDFNEFQLKIPSQFVDKARPYVGREVTFGIRPEDIYDRSMYQGSIDSNTTLANVEIVERLGAEEFVYFATNGGYSFIAKYDPQVNVHMGDTNREVIFDLNRSHLFDKETEMAIY